MEEVYVIRLRGVQSTSTSDTSSSAVDTNDVIRGSVLGLGVLHVIFGVLVLVFGALRTGSERSEPPEVVFGTLFGPLFVATGICAVLTWRRPFRKLKMKVFFGMAALSFFSSATFLGLCFLGVVYFHSVPRLFGDAAHVTANAILATVGETVVALLSVLTAGSAIWKRFQCDAFKPSTNRHQKVIVKTDIYGGKPSEGVFDEEMVRHVSPHCVISLRAADEQTEAIKKVRDYLHAQDELSFTFSDPESLREEQEVDSTWRDRELEADANSCVGDGHYSTIGAKSSNHDSGVVADTKNVNDYYVVDARNSINNEIYANVDAKNSINTTKNAINEPQYYTESATHEVLDAKRCSSGMQYTIVDVKTRTNGVESADSVNDHQANSVANFGPPQNDVKYASSNAKPSIYVENSGIISIKTFEEDKVKSAKQSNNGNRNFEIGECKHWKVEEQDLGVDSQNWRNEVLSLDSNSVEDNNDILANSKYVSDDS